MKELRVSAGARRRPLGFALYAAFLFIGPLILFLNFFYYSLGLMLTGYSLIIINILGEWLFRCLPNSFQSRVNAIAFRKRHLVFDIDFVRLEEDGQILWETGWADIVRYHHPMSGRSTFTDSQGRTYRLAGWEWLVAARELARSDAVFVSSKYVGTWPLVSMSPAMLIVAPLIGYGALRTPGGAFVIVTMTCAVLAGAVYLAMSSRRRKRIVEVVKGERPVAASSVFFLREIIDPRHRRFEFSAEGKAQVPAAEKRKPWRAEVEAASIVFEGREMLLQLPGEPPLVIEPDSERSNRGYVKRNGERLLVPLDLYLEVEPPAIDPSPE